MNLSEKIKIKSEILCFLKAYCISYLIQNITWVYLQAHLRTNIYIKLDFCEPYYDLSLEY